MEQRKSNTFKSVSSKCTVSGFIPAAYVPEEECYLIRSYCEIIFIHWKFNFVFFMGRAIHKFKIPTKYLFTILSYIGYNLKSMNSCLHEHVHHHHTTKFLANEMMSQHCGSPLAYS